MCAERNTDKKKKSAATGCSDGKENAIMSKPKQNFSIDVEGMKAVCPLGEVVGNKMITQGKIPVISCEGGCFRGEIARVAAHLVAKEGPYSRGCHGEMFTAPRRRWPSGPGRPTKSLLSMVVSCIVTAA